MENNLSEGSKNQLPRLTTKEIRNEALKFFNLEKGLLFTFLALLRKPYDTIQTYLNVDRRKFSNPIQFMVIGVGLYLLLISFHPSFKSMTSYMDNLNQKVLVKEDKDEGNRRFNAQKKAQELTFSYQNAFYLLGIPIISFLTLWLIGWKYNYAENMVINAYAFGTTMWASSVLTVLTFFIDRALIVMPLLTLITFILITYLYKRIFKASWLMSFITMVLTQGLLMLMIGVIMAGVAFYFQLST